MPGTNEAFSRVKIDAQLKDQGWEVLNTNAVRFEYVLPDATKADYVLCDRNGRSLAVVEAKKASTNPAEAADQAVAYAKQLKVPYIFLANGEEIRFWEWEREAHPRPVKTFFSQGDLERRAATAQVKRDVLNIPIDRHIVERDYQTACIDALCKEIQLGRRKMLVEMATGTGKTRTAAAFIKRLQAYCGAAFYAANWPGICGGGSTLLAGRYATITAAQFATFPTLEVFLSGLATPIQLAPFDYLVPVSAHTTVGQTGYYYLGVRSLESRASVVYLGDVFMRNRIVMFDNVNNRVGFAAATSACGR